jgi:hypothetical protein
MASPGGGDKTTKRSPAVAIDQTALQADQEQALGPVWRREDVSEPVINVQ